MAKVSEEFPIICHYTTEVGLYGILESGVLRATNYRFLNDYSEFMLCKHALVRHLSKQEKLEEYLTHVFLKNNETQGFFDNVESFISNCVSYLIEEKYRALLETLEAEFYVLSFSALSEESFILQNGLLSQWRAYASNGGYAIHIDTKQLETCLEEENRKYFINYLMGNCIYSDDESKFLDEFKDDLDVLEKYSIQYFESQRINKPTALLESLASASFQSFVNCISRYKHQAFKEENEVRISGVLFKKDHGDNDPRKIKERKFRQGARGMTPYIDVFENASSLPIKRIVVGPHKDKELRAESLRVWLRNKNMEGIEVTVSDIPYI